MLCFCNARTPVDSIVDAMLTVSPKRQYLGMRRPTTPAITEPNNSAQLRLEIMSELLNSKTVTSPTCVQANANAHLFARQVWNDEMKHSFH